MIRLKNYKTGKNIDPQRLNKNATKQLMDQKNQREKKHENFSHLNIFLNVHMVFCYSFLYYSLCFTEGKTKKTFKINDQDCFHNSKI